MTAKLSKLNQSVEKVLQIIEIMAHERQPMRLQDVAAGCGMPASTVLRMLNTLLVYGYVNQDPHSLRYSLSLKFAQIGSRVCEQVSLRDIVHPLLAELSRECREASCLAIEEDMEVVYTDVVDGPDSMLKIMQRIGKRAPMHSTGIGKLLLLLRQRAGYRLFIPGKLCLAGLYLGLGVRQLFLVFRHLGPAVVIVQLGIGKLGARIGKLLLCLRLHVVVALLA